MPLGNIMIAGLSLGTILFAAALIDVIFLLLSRGKSAPIYSNTLGLLLSLFVKRRINPAMLVIIGGITGVLMLGGIGAAWASTVGSLGTASISGSTDVLPQNECIISQARMAVATGSVSFQGNGSFTQDDSDMDNYYYDTLNASGSGLVTAGVDINGTLTVSVRDPPSTGSECNAKVYIVPPSYYDQVSEGADAEIVWDVVDSSRSISELDGITGPNRADAIGRKLNIYLNDGAVATASSNQEVTNIQFAAGEAQNTLGYAIDLSSANYDRLKKNANVQFVFKQQVGDKPSSSDPTIYTITMRKGASG